MAADPKQELHALIDQLTPEDAIALLASARSITARRRRAHNLPVLHTAPPITNIDVLRGDVFPPEEDADEFDTTIRRWREEGSGRRG